MIGKMGKIDLPSIINPAAGSKCDQKVRGIGSCDAAGIGYEFDSGTEKCAKKIASGCTFEIPFNSLEECQEACGVVSVSGEDVSFETVLKGTYSEISEKKNYTITDLTGWMALLEKTGAELPAPVDFAKDMVAVVFQGEYSVSGYEIEIEKIIEDEKNIKVLVKEFSPGSNCMIALAVTRPYHVVKFKKSDKKVVFNVMKKVRECD